MRYLLSVRAGRASPSRSQARTSDADTPSRWATSPIFSDSPKPCFTGATVGLPARAAGRERWADLAKDLHASIPVAPADRRFKPRFAGLQSPAPHPVPQSRSRFLRRVTISGGAI